MKRSIVRIVLASIFISTVVLSGLNAHTKPQAVVEQKFYTDQELIEVTTPTTVKMVRPEGQSFASGSLVKMPSGKSQIITNWHVCYHAGGEVVHFKLFDNSAVTSGKVLKMDMVKDLCVVEIPQEITKIKPSLELGTENHRFQRIMIMGHPIDEPLQPSFGYILEMRHEQVGMTVEPDKACPVGAEKREFFFQTACLIDMYLYATTAVTYPGNSGSPAVDVHGKLVAVLNSGPDNTNHGNVIPLSDIKEFIKEF